MTDIEHQLSVNEMVSAVRTALSENDQANESLANDIATALGVFANVVQVAGWVVPFASTAAGIIKAMVGSQTAADPALQAVQDEITRLIKYVHDLGDHVDMEHITERLDDVQATLDLLKLHGKSHPNVQAKMPHDAMALVRDFGSREFWTRPFFADLVYHDPAPGWIDAQPAIDADTGQVLDPQLIMPGYLRAIDMWLCTFALMDPTGHPPELDLDIGTVIANLGRYHDELVDGIRIGRTPQDGDIVTFQHGSPTFGAWPSAGGHVGAVDAHTNRPLVTPWFPWQGNVLEWTDTDLQIYRAGLLNFQVRFVLGGKARQKALYLAQGYQCLWAARQHVRKIAGQPFEITNPAPCWSLRELFAIVSPALSVDQRGGRTSMRSVIIGLAHVTGGQPPAPGQPVTISVRLAIKLATP